MLSEQTGELRFREIQESKEMHNEEKYRLKVACLFLLTLVLPEVLVISYLIQWIGTGWTLILCLAPKLLGLLGLRNDWYKKAKHIADQVKIKESTRSLIELASDEDYKHNKSKLRNFQLALRLILMPGLIVTFSAFIFNFFITVYIIHRRKSAM